MPMIAIITTAMIMAISVVIKGASAGASGSIGCIGAGAGPTDNPVASYELQYDLEVAKVAMTVYNPSSVGVHLYLKLP